MSSLGPIFVRGFSRSGGTLVVTILDAHPAVGMSYELYPNLLLTTDDQPADGNALVRILESSRNTSWASRKIQDRKLRTFVARANRGGLDARELASLFRLHMAEGGTFSGIDDRLRFIGRCGEAAMRRKGRSRWGMKCSNHFEQYHAVWPNAVFLNVIRDGRDVLASQLKMGTFNKTPAEIGEGWANTHRRFREFLRTTGARGHEVYYERLVEQPEAEAKKIAEACDLPFDPRMLEFHKQDLSIYKADHLSMAQISQPINASRKGRWQRELKPEQVEDFYASARDTMVELGYLEA